LTGNVAEPFGLPQGSPNTKRKDFAQRHRAAKKNEDTRRLQYDDCIKADS
jgi:hypothetical protein